jgi:hypothetical protein
MDLHASAAPDYHELTNSIALVFDRALNPVAQIVSVIIPIVNRRADSLQEVWDSSTPCARTEVVGQVVDSYPYQRVVPRVALLDFKLDPWTVGRVFADQDDSGARSVESINDKPLQRCAPLRLGLFPERAISKSNGLCTKDDAAVAHAVHAPDVSLIVESEVHVPHRHLQTRF